MKVGDRVKIIGGALLAQLNSYIKIKPSVTTLGEITYMEGGRVFVKLDAGCYVWDVKMNEVELCK